MSITISSLAVFLLNQLITRAGIEAIEESDLLAVIKVLVSIVSAVGVWWGRYRLGDITWYGRRK